MLAGDAPFGPIEVLQRVHFRKQTEQCALVRVGAISLVEQRADDFVCDLGLGLRPRAAVTTLPRTARSAGGASALQ